MEEPYGDFEGYQGGFALDKVQETLQQRELMQMSGGGHGQHHINISHARSPHGDLISPTYVGGSGSATHKQEEEK